MHSYIIHMKNMLNIKFEKDKYEAYKEVLGSNGLVKHHIKEYLEEITDGINRVLSEKIDKRVRIYEEKDKIIIDIEDSRNKNKCNYLIYSYYHSQFIEIDSPF